VEKTLARAWTVGIGECPVCIGIRLLPPGSKQESLGASHDLFGLPYLCYFHDQMEAEWVVRKAIVSSGSRDAAGFFT